MSRFINGIVRPISFDSTGNAGEYSFTSASYTSFADVEGLGAYAVQPGFVIYTQASNANTFEMVPGVVHRYRITLVNAENTDTLSGVMLWDEDGDEIDTPSQGTPAIISQTSTNHQFGFPVSEGVYSELSQGMSLGALNLDNMVVTDKINTSGSGGGSAADLIMGPAPDGSYLGGAINIKDDQKIADAIDQINSLVGFLVPAAPPTLDTLTSSVSGYTSYSANLSAGNSNTGPYSAGAILPRVTKAPTPVLTFTNFGSADKGTLGVKVNTTSFATFDLASAFVEANRNGNQGVGYAGSSLPITVSSSRLQIFSVGRYNNFGAFQTGTALVTPQLLDSVPGYNTYQLLHNTGSTTEASSIYDLFFDATTVPSVGTLSAELATSSIKYLSGIPAYGAGSSIKFSMTSCQKAFANTYNTSGQWAQITSNGVTTISTTTLLLSDTSAIGISNPPAISDTPSFSNKIIFLTSSVTTDTPVWSVSILSPRGSSSTSVASLGNFYINTFGNDSTATQDTFVDETYRIPSGSGQYPNIYSTVASVNAATWDSTTSLASNELMLFKGALKYANQSFALYLPMGPNYSGRSGVQSYVRKVTWASATNGVLYITPSSIPAGVGIQVKLPGLTGWLNPLSSYLGGTPSSDGDGCLVGSTSVVSTELRIPMTFGTNSTVNSGNTVLVRLFWDNSVSASFGITKLRIASS